MNPGTEKKNAAGQYSVSSVADDKALILRCASGDKAASEIFVRRFSNLIYGAVQHILKCKHIRYAANDLEDLHHSVFLKLFENQCKRLKQFTGKNGCSLATWVRVVTVRTVLNHFRQKGIDSMVGRERGIPLDALPEIEDRGLNAPALMEKKERHRLLREGMSSLSLRERLFLRLHLDHGHSISRAAEIMKISVQNAYTIKHRAINKLKLFIKTKFEE